MIIKLVRHGESDANIGAVDPRHAGDHTVGLSARGHEQAAAAGRSLGASFLQDALVYLSPYRRTRETLEAMLTGAGVARDGLRVYEDPRLREVEHGYDPVEPQEALRKTHGWFYYRFKGGESPADCYDRTSGFLETLMRQADRKQAERVLIVTHGLTIRCFVMRFLHLRVEDFDRLENPDNCATITLGLPEALNEPPLFSRGQWGVSGLRLRAD
jgi:broad specificity phosphatase PhoE